MSTCPPDVHLYVHLCPLMYLLVSTSRGPMSTTTRERKSYHHTRFDSRPSLQTQTDCARTYLGPATGLRKIERAYPQLARVANPYHRQYLYILANEIKNVYMTNMRFSIVLMLPPTSYTPLHHSRWGQN